MSGPFLFTYAALKCRLWRLFAGGCNSRRLMQPDNDRFKLDQLQTRGARRRTLLLQRTARSSNQSKAEDRSKRCTQKSNLVGCAIHGALLRCVDRVDAHCREAADAMRSECDELHKRRRELQSRGPIGANRALRRRNEVTKRRDDIDRANQRRARPPAWTSLRRRHEAPAKSPAMPSRRDPRDRPRDSRHVTSPLVPAAARGVSEFPPGSWFARRSP